MIVEIISMLPNINTQDGCKTIREWRILIGSGNNSKAAAFFHEPGPTGAEAGCSRGCEFGFEIIEGGKGGIDGFGKIAFWYPAGLGADHFPE